MPEAGLGGPRLAEVVAALSLATDLGLGQPMQHGLRTCLIACRLAEALDVGPAEREATYWVALLAMAGCTGESSEIAEAFGDDIEFRHGLYDMGPSVLDVPRYFLSKAGSDAGLVRKVRLRAELLAIRQSATKPTRTASMRVASSSARRRTLRTRPASDPALDRK